MIFPLEQFKETQSFVNSNQYFMLFSLLLLVLDGFMHVCNYFQYPTPTSLPSTQAILKDPMLGHGEEKWLSVEEGSLGFNFIHSGSVSCTIGYLLSPGSPLPWFCSCLCMFQLSLDLSSLLYLHALKLLQSKLRSYRIEFQSSFYFVSLVARQFPLLLYR